jgi:hypothetical protein
MCNHVKSIKDVGRGESMNVMKSISILSILIMAAVIAQDAMALPYSSYVDPNGKSWTGRKTETRDNFTVKLEWTVYDIVAKPAEFAWAGLEFPDDRYVYVYRVTNLSGGDIGSFCILDNPHDTDMINWSSRIDGTQAVQAGGGGIMPDNPSLEQGKWVWSSGGVDTVGAISAYLVFGSQYAPKVGDYKVEVPSGDVPNPGEVPEPCTLALIGIASAMFAAKRGKKRQAG